MPGPPGKPASTRRRRNSQPGARILPAAGRQGNPPRWPLHRPASDEEAALWAELWATPQAHAWNDVANPRVVARYVLWSVAAESDAAAPPVALLAELRQLEDRLGLSPMAMTRLRWTIEQVSSIPDTPTPASGQASPANAPTPAPAARPPGPPPRRVRVPT
jgi:hypothetical protein